MIYTELTKKALIICYEAHASQVDKGGVPYVFHAIHVAEQMDNEYDVCVALLHDVLEDTSYELEHIISMGFPCEIIEALKCITKTPNQDYMDYIKIVKTNDRAARVKLVDLEHNSDLSRLKVVTEADMLRLKKYELAKKELMKR